MHANFQNAATAVRWFVLLLVVGLSAAGCSTTSNLGMPEFSPLSEKYSAIIVDAEDGSILYQYQADVQRYPASLTKMMTIYFLFEALDEGRIVPTTPIPVSSEAARRPPTKIGFKPGETISVEEAILALIVKSANDVATAVGEFFGGTEERFAQMMTAKARQLGMSETIFRNANGLPDSAQVTTARDMAILALALRRDFPVLYRYFANKDFVYRGKLIEGHNDLIGTVAGVDGIKTGYIRASGFNLATSARRGGRSVVGVVMGGDNASERNDRMRELVGFFLPRASLGR